MRYHAHPLCHYCKGTGHIEDEFGSWKTCWCRDDGQLRRELEAEQAQRNAAAYTSNMFSKPYPYVATPKPVVPDQLTEWDIE